MAYTQVNNLDQCRYCRLREPEVPIRTSKGRLLGECIPCYNANLRARIGKENLYKAFYNKDNNLFQFNYSKLLTLGIGAYSLIYRNSKESAGCIVLKRDSYFISLFREDDLYKIDLYACALWLSNLNVYIDAKPLNITAPNGAAQTVDDVGIGYSLKDLNENLTIFDSKLRLYAEKRLDKAIADAKGHAENARKAGRRSKNLDENIEPKPRFK